MLLDNIEKDRTDKTKYTFTNDQQKAIDNIISFIATPFNPANFITGLTGAGGTGKTFITKYIIDHCIYSNSVILCTSPTHKACRVLSSAIGGKEVVTIQSAFGLRINLKLEDFNPNNPQFDPMAKPKLDNVKLLIIDESSMIPAKLVTFIIKQCKSLNIKIIFIGDESQLHPVEEDKSIAFNRCIKINRLTEIVRQAQGNPISDLLAMLRKDITNKTYNFIKFVSRNIGLAELNEKEEGFLICGRQEFKDLISSHFSDESYTKNIDKYRIVAYTNPCVAQWNNFVRNTIIKDCNRGIINKHDLIMSYTTIVNEYLETVIINSEEYIIKDIVNYTDSRYKFKGFLVKFQLVHGGIITKPLFIIDHKDTFTIQMYYKIVNTLITEAKKATGHTRIGKWKQYYEFKKKYLLAANIIDKNGNIICTRDIDYGFAITAHKAQGSTYENVFVDLNDMIYNKNNIVYTDQDDMLRRLYVACSRAHKNLILCYGS